MSYTPGPWNIWEHDQRVVIAPNGDVVAEVNKWGSTDDPKIISAAPDLLEALQAILDSQSDLQYHDDPLSDCKTCKATHKARLAIAKATK